MGWHRWRRRPSKHFGEVWVPFVRIGLLSANGRWRSVTLQLDSGAIVSLLRRSVADLLGLRLEAGRRIDLSSIGGASTIVYVHTIQTRVDAKVIRNVRFAIAEREDVPNLLGRLDVFDYLRIVFDPVNHETQVTSV